MKKGMMTRKDTMWIISLLISVIVTTAEATVLEQHTVIEFLLQKVAELERSQQEFSGYQSKMLLELNYVKSKLQDSERRISELETIVYVKRSDDYTESLIATLEDEPVDKHVFENGTNVLTEDKFIKQTSEHKWMRSNKPGNGIREGRAIASKQIAFCATIASGKAAPLNSHEIIHFDTVLHNEGNGFNIQTGIFTCPLSGTYFFSLSLMISPGYVTAVQLMVNGQVKVNSYAHSSSSYDQGSISLIVRCEAGHNVWVSMRDTSYVYGDYYTSFSGFYLWGDATGSR